MANNLTRRTTTTDLSFANDQAEIEQRGDQANATDIYQRGVRDMVSQRVKASKIAYGTKLTADIRNHAHATADGLMDTMYDRLNTPGRDQRHQERMESLTERILDEYEDTVSGLVKMADHDLMQDAHREVNLPPDKKRWWQK